MLKLSCDIKTIIYFVALLQMLTPRFSLSQDDKYLHVTIYAPFTHIDKTEVFMDEDEFRFYSKPYYLRLHLPGEVVENEDAAASWDAESSSFIVKCPKKVEGEHFSGLDMLTELLTPKGEKEIKQKIEVLEESNNYDEDEEECEEDIDFYFEQTLPSEEREELTECKADGYGFAFEHHNVYKSLMAEYGEILDVKDPDNLSQTERDNMRKEKEDGDFSSDHYLCDLYDSVEEIQACLEQEAPFRSCVTGEADLSSRLTVDTKSELLAFSAEEQELMLGLPRKKVIVPPPSLAPVHFGLADILYGHCYSLRVLGPDCVEAGWTVAKLSASLSSLGRLTSARGVLVSSMRRALSYPLQRHYDLANRVWEDVITILHIGTPAVLKCLLSLIPTFNNSPGQYIFNQLYINDYAVWVQSVPASHFESLAQALHKTLVKLTKDDMDLELVELEQAAQMIVQEEEEAKVKALTDSMSQASILNRDTRDSDDDSDSETDEDDSSSSDE